MGEKSEPDLPYSEEPDTLKEDTLSYGAATGVRTVPPGALLYDRTVPDVSGREIMVELPHPLSHATVRVRVEAVEADVRSPEQIREVLENARREFGSGRTLAEVEVLLEDMRAEWDNRGWDDPLLDRDPQ